MSLELLRSQMAKSSERVHLNNAGLAPISLPAKQEIDYWSKRFFEEGFLTDADYMKRVAETRSHLAKLIGCTTPEVAFFQNTSNAISQVAFQLELKANDEVLLWDQEYSSLLYPVQQAAAKAQAKLVFVKSNDDLSTPTEGFLNAINDRTRFIALSHVQFQTGSSMNLTPVLKRAKEVGAFVLIDAMQSLGLVPFELWPQGVDAVVGGNHKWLLSPVGLGFVALQQKHIFKMKSLNVGSGTFGSCDDPADLLCAPKTDASKFESGAKQVLEITALGKSLELIQKVGIGFIQKEAVRLAQILNQSLQNKGWSTRTNCNNSLCPTPHLVFLDSANPDRLKLAGEKLKAKNITHAWRGGGIRLAPHAFNTEAEIEFVLSELAKT